MFSFVELLVKIIDLFGIIQKKMKREKLKDEYEEIDDGLDGYLRGDKSDLNGRVQYKPSGKKPDFSNIGNDGSGKRGGDK